MELNAAFLQIMNGLKDVMKSNGFTACVPKGTEDGTAPISVNNGKSVLTYTGDKGTVKIEYFENKISLFCSLSTENADSDNFKNMSTTLFDIEKADERSVKYVVTEIADGIKTTYADEKKAKEKLPKPISKSAAQKGSVYYDLVTLGSRFVQIYPELRDAYRENIEKYGEFLADDFFINHGNEAFRKTVKENNPQKMKKLFNMLNDVYNNGLNQTQSVIAVTILGSLYDDQELLANCVDYMEDMSLNVIEINKLLKRSSWRSKLEHPPVYKPKKQKKKNMMSSLMNGGM
ncbi:MAG: hypothetical protein PUB20_05545 [Clostridia bacterium]|nr:hypothetical protein [Clostridia bacterium]